MRWSSRLVRHHGRKMRAEVEIAPGVERKDLLWKPTKARCEMPSWHGNCIRDLADTFSIPRRSGREASTRQGKEETA